MTHQHRVEDPGSSVNQFGDNGHYWNQQQFHPFGDVFGMPGQGAALPLEGRPHGHVHHHQADAPPEHHGRLHQHHPGAAHDSARHHLPDLSLSGEQAPHQSRHHGRRRDAANPTERQPDSGLGSWGHTGSAQASIAAAAHNSVGQQSYLPRRGSDYYGQHVPAGLGCTSASTNMFFDGLKAAGKVSDRDYARIHAIGNDAAYSNLQHLGVARPVSGRELKPGDWAYFKTPGHKHGHSGVVFEGDNGTLMVANNHGGRTIATPLSVMEQRYRTVRGLRAT